MPQSFTLTGGTILMPDGGLERSDLHVAGGQIVDAAGPQSQPIDCSGCLVLPGIVDVHGDAFELELHPRPGVDIAPQIAMASVDRQLMGNGITTAYHGLTVSWEPGARSLEAGRRFMAAFDTQRPAFAADHRVQLRWETFAHDAIVDIAQWLSHSSKPTLAFNDHTTSTLQTVGTGNEVKLTKWAQRAGVSLQDYLATVETVGQLADHVADKIREVADLASRAGAVMLSHDERRVEDRDSFRALGATVCEFPLSVNVARAAVAEGEHTVMGGPNVIRGGSHTGAMSAEEAVETGVCTVLASDYYYPSLLHAAERIVNRGVLPLGEAWNLISRNAAAAMRLTDRGTLAPGQRADIVVLNASGPWYLAHTMAGGTVMSFAR